MYRRPAHGTRDTHTYRHTPIYPLTTTPSERDDKRLAARTTRARVRVWLLEVDPHTPTPVLPQQSRTWGWGKDGKHYWGDTPCESRSRRPHRLYQR